MTPEQIDKGAQALRAAVYEVVTTWDDKPEALKEKWRGYAKICAEAMGLAVVVKTMGITSVYNLNSKIEDELHRALVSLGWTPPPVVAADGLSFRDVPGADMMDDQGTHAVEEFLSRRRNMDYAHLGAEAFVPPLEHLVETLEGKERLKGMITRAEGARTERKMVLLGDSAGLDMRMVDGRLVETRWVASPADGPMHAVRTVSGDNDQCTQCGEPKSLYCMTGHKDPDLQHPTKEAEARVTAGLAAFLHGHHPACNVVHPAEETGVCDCEEIKEFETAAKNGGPRPPADALPGCTTCNATGKVLTLNHLNVEEEIECPDCDGDGS